MNLSESGPVIFNQGPEHEDALGEEFVCSNVLSGLNMEQLSLDIKTWM